MDSAVAAIGAFNVLVALLCTGQTAAYLQAAWNLAKAGSCRLQTNQDVWTWLFVSKPSDPLPASLLCSVSFRKPASGTAGAATRSAQSSGR